MLENVFSLSRPLIYLTPSRTVRCHNCNSYCCLTRPVPSHEIYLRDRYRLAMTRVCNALWAGDYDPVVHHRDDLMDPYCGAPGLSSSWDSSDPTTRSPPRNTSYSSTHAALLYWVSHELITTITCTFHVIVVDSTRATRPVLALGQCSTPHYGAYRLKSGQN